MKLSSFLFYVGFFIFNVGCQSRQQVEFDRGIKSQSRGDFSDALLDFEKVMKREPSNSISLRAARESLKILLYEVKNYEKAIDLLKFLILYSKDPEERWRSQNQIAQIYFDHLAWYDKALVEYSKLLSGDLPKEEKLRVRLAIARSYYYLGQFSQSWSETNHFLTEQDLSEDFLFDVYLLQANIQQALKKFTDAAKSFERMMAQFPEKSKKENIGINLALCFEELGAYKDALKTLEEMKSYYQPKDYIDLRIKKIKDRLLNQPKKRLKK